LISRQFLRDIGRVIDSLIQGGDRISQRIAIRLTWLDGNDDGDDDDDDAELL
jgi:hypothetical protein